MEPEGQRTWIRIGKYRGGRVPLPGSGGSGRADCRRPRRRADRRDGMRHVRRMSNWTAAALIVGTGAATVALAHHACPPQVRPRPAAGADRRAAAAGPGRCEPGASGPPVTHSVATTSGSGVTTTTTTRTVERQDHRHPRPARRPPTTTTDGDDDLTARSCPALRRPGSGS